MPGWLGNRRLTSGKPRCDLSILDPTQTFMESGSSQAISAERPILAAVSILHGAGLSKFGRRSEFARALDSCDEHLQTLPITCLEEALPLTVDLEIAGAAIRLELRAGMSTIVVGANGSGKTKLAVECERQLGASAHRISAQRMLALDPSIEKISEEAARNQLRYGYIKPNDLGGPQQARDSQRWGQAQPRFILNDAGHLLQVLFAEQANTAVKSYNAFADGIPIESSETFIRKLKVIFHRVLPTRRLNITADDIAVSAVADDAPGKPYSITQMSDGEKAVFYMIGQTLVADEGSVFIMDEPEIHIHRSILGRLWDELVH